MLRTVALCLALALSCFARADDTPIVVRVVAPDGKPAAGTKAWVFRSYETEACRKEPTALVADAAGKLLVPAFPDANGPWRIFAREADRFGWDWLEAPGPDQEDTPELKIVLIETSKRAGRVMTIEGKPVAGAMVMPLHYAKEKQEQASGERLPQFIGLPQWESTRLSVKTDADGRFNLTAPPTGYSVTYQVKAEGFGESEWVATSGVALDTHLPAPGAVAFDIVGVGPAVVKGLRWVLEANDNGEAAPKVHLALSRQGTFDGNATLTVPNVMPGRYLLMADGFGQFPCLLEKSSAVEVVSDKTAKITAKFGPAATVTGLITDKEGKGIAGARMLLIYTSVTGRTGWKKIHLRTDSDGKYTYHGSAGSYYLDLLPPPDGYARPLLTRATVETAKVEIGKIHTFEPIALPKSVTFSGKVVHADGKPAADALVREQSFVFVTERRGTGKTKADKDGNFTFPNLGPDDTVAPRVRLGKAVNIVQTYQLDKVILPVTITVSEANATALKGRVLDARGSPIPLAEIAILATIPGVGRKAGSSTECIPATTKSDAAGRYEFMGLWAGDEYRVEVTAQGYTKVQSPQILGEVGKAHDFGTIRLMRTGLSARGVVVGPDGKPIGGAEVFSVDGPIRASTPSAADGSFTLNGLVEGRGFVFARKAGYRLAVARITIGDEKPVSITLARADGSPVPQPQGSAGYLAALDSMSGHVFTRIWETHPTFGFGAFAVEAMAPIDLAKARKWCDEEKKRTEGKSDLTPYLERGLRKKTLFSEAKNTPDEALAIIRAMKAVDGFYEAVQISERMLAVDKAKALLFAEEAVVKARQQDLPKRISALAWAGDLAVRAGNVVGGKKVVGEAVELALKLGPDQLAKDEMVAGIAAAHIAPHNWARAEWLLNTIADPRDFNRFLANIAANIARTDLPKTRQLLTRFKPDNSFYAHDARLLIAYVIAADQPDEAVRLVDGEPIAPHRFKGYIRLAALFTPSDRARGMKMIDTAFDLLDSDPEGFHSWGGLGNRSVLAAVGAIRAKEIGYPDVPQLIARCLALRPATAGRVDDRRHEDEVMKLATLLALVDPNTARQLLETIGTPDDLIQRAVTQSQDWLFALALAYPENANPLVDNLIQRAKANPEDRRALSGTGLIELIGILTAEDRLREFAIYSSRGQEIYEDD